MLTPIAQTENKPAPLTVMASESIFRPAAPSGPGPDWTAARIAALARPLASQECGRPLDADEAAVYARRLAACIQYHAAKCANEAAIGFDELVTRLRTGNLGHGASGEDVLADVILAQALERCEPKAAERFEREFMPLARATAWRIGGRRAVDLIENFAAELILPRGPHRPRIARFEGRTPLAAWLRAVVANFCTALARREQPIGSEALEQVADDQEDAAAEIDRRQVETVLRPLLVRAARRLSVDDRRVLTLLVLERLPQHELAARMGLSSGSITRRRQRALSRLGVHIRQLVRKHVACSRLVGYLELLSGTGDPRLNQSLAEALAAGVRGDTLRGATRARRCS